MAGALGVVITTDVPAGGQHAQPVYVDDGLPIVGPSQAIVVTNGEVPQLGGPALPVRLAPAGTPALGPALPVYVVSGSLGGNAAAPSTLPNGLISYWKLDEASGTGIDSVGTNTLTDNNTVTSAAGKVGTARLFKAAENESLSCADNASFSGLSAGMTISMWLYPISLTNGDTPLSKATYNTDCEWVCDVANAVNRSLRMYVAKAAADITTANAVSPNNVITLNTWTHVVWLFDGTLSGNANRLKLYTDGVARTLTFADTIPATLVAGTPPLRVGAWSGGLTRYFDGRIDEVKLASRAWTPSEVAEDYANGLAGRALL